MKEASPRTILRQDYTPYPWRVSQLELHFDIAMEQTRVRSVMSLEWCGGARAERHIELDGQGLELLEVRLDGQELGPDRYTLGEEKLVVLDAPEQCELALDVAIAPSQNTALEGLYPSGRFLLTQCEAEGFRKITYFPDRPDVMTRYRVTLDANRTTYPVLLSNGNLVEETDIGNGRHRACWDDPFAKPSYLFALVAGDLACIQDRFVTCGGREVALKIYVEHENTDRCGHAMESLIESMRWDEERFGLEYDLDVYNIVATNDFNMGAMENKSLNIFNSKYVLARPDTATDTDYQHIQGVIGHEYFHNWTGNRVTCRDWFQLTLKEGLTVFRDQEFSSDVLSRAVKRIQDVRVLRSRQFAEDAGAMSHPIRPDKYKEINNFYTMTVYQKGAEVIRMIHTLLGEEGFQAGMRRYVERHDGQAVTCDDFLAAMADATGTDLAAFSRWYSQSGTPEVTATGRYDPELRRYTLALQQRTPPTADQAEKTDLVIPVRMGLMRRDGRPLALRLAGESGVTTERVLILDRANREFVFEDVSEPPVPSLLRDFSAPVRLRFDYSSEELALLMAHDVNAFVRWEAAQTLAQREILANVERRARGRALLVGADTVSAFRTLLTDDQADPALVAEAFMLPSEDYLADQMAVVDVDGIHAAREFVRAAIAAELKTPLLDSYSAPRDMAYDKSADAMARRSLRNTCLAYLVAIPGGGELARQQFEVSDNMTDTLAAMRGLLHHGADDAAAALESFEARWQEDALVMDKWFAIQASCPGKDSVARVESLRHHPAFNIRNPNKVRSLVGVFSAMNPTGFHAADGAGYRWLADRIIELDALNPQVAARMTAAFNQWTRYDEERKSLMRDQLERIASASGLSPDVSEIVGNALNMEPDEKAA
jgi:aminopeptidase N